MVTVYLTKHMIQAVAGGGGKGGVSVQGFWQSPIPPDVFHSAGNIADEDKFTQLISEFWEHYQLPHKDIILVLDSGQLVNKMLTAPLVKRAEMPDFLAPEFSDVNRNGDQIYSYWTKSEDKKRKSCRVMATMGDREYIGKYIQLFEKMNIELQEICTPITSVLALLDRMPKVTESATVLQIWNGKVLSNLLLLDGVYTYSSVTQMFQEPGTPGFSVEVARQVSRLGQFMKAQQMEQIITNVYLAGVSPEDYNYCVEGIYQVNPKIEVAELDTQMLTQAAANPKDCPLENMLFPMGALFLGERYVGLRAQYGIDPEKIKQRREMRKKMLPVFILGGIFAGAVLILGGVNIFFRFQLKYYTEYNQQPSIVAAVQEFDQLSTDNAVLAAKLGELQADATAQDSYPMPNSSVIQVLRDCCGSYVTLDESSYSYDAASGVLSVSTSASDVNRIHEYVSVLRTVSIFSNVTYTGYQYNQQTAQWSINVVCTLATNAGR